MTDNPDAELPLKRETFVHEYIQNGGNATQAAIAAGYSESCAHVTGHRLINDAKVCEAIDERREQIRARWEITEDAVLQAVAAIAFEKLSENGKERFYQAPRILKAAELLGKNLKMWTDKVQVSGVVAVNVVDPYAESERPDALTSERQDGET